MYQSPYDWIQNACHCKNDCQEVQAHGKGEVAFDGHHHPFGKP